MIWKSAILLWVAFFIVRGLVRSNTSEAEKIMWALGSHVKWTPDRIILIIVYFAAIITSLATLVWFLFFVL